jgi:hypothetical protein
MRLETTIQMEELKNGAAPAGDAPTSASSNTTQQNHSQPTNSNQESLLLDKLHDMVPIMPQGRELSKLEIINHAIDYIRHLGEMVVDEDKAQEA